MPYQSTLIPDQWVKMTSPCQQKPSQAEMLLFSYFCQESYPQSELTVSVPPAVLKLQLNLYGQNLVEIT